MTVVLSCSDVQALLTLPDCIAAVEQAFRVHAEHGADACGCRRLESRGMEK
jgi:hypothetical protein